MTSVPAPGGSRRRELTAALDRAESTGDVAEQVRAVLDLAAAQPFNETPGELPVRLHAVLGRVTAPGDRVRIGAALARCWAYANQPGRARGFADEALREAETLGDPVLVCAALDATLATGWGPDDLERRRDGARRLGDVAAHLPDPDARLQAHLWGLTVAWEVLDVPRMHREMRALERLGDESPRAAFFAASRRLALDLLRGRSDTAAELRRRASEAARRTPVPDAEAVDHAMAAYTALLTGDVRTCAAEAEAHEAYALAEGVASVLAEAGMLWIGAGRPDRVAGVVASFAGATPSGLPRDGDWLLTLQCVLEGALYVGDRDVVATVVALLTPYEGRAVVNAGAVAFHGVTDDTLSRGYAALGQAEEAVRLREQAVAAYRRLGASWWRDRLLSSDGQAAAGRPGPRELVLRRRADGVWDVGTAVLPDLRGLGYLHALLERPDVPVAATDLVGAQVGRGFVVEDDLGELLDERARRELTRRVEQLDRTIADGDPDRASAARDEREQLRAALRAATGLGGRARTAGSGAERSRIAVRKALVAAMARIAEVDPWLGRHLRDRVRTGSECRYESSPDEPVRWTTR